MMNPVAASHRGCQGGWVAQIAKDGLDIQAFQRGIVASLAQQRADSVAVGKQTADQIRSEMTARSCDEYQIFPCSNSFAALLV